jgi:hypothetical protein
MKMTCLGIRRRSVAHGSGSNPVRVRKTYTIQNRTGQAGFGSDPCGKAQAGFGPDPCGKARSQA